MAFSYSDKNFTVIGNLCFVHILLDGTQEFYDIPSAISDRMLLDDFYCIYIEHGTVSTYGDGGPSVNPNYAHFKSGKIYCTGQLLDNGYLYCYFPIDSNK